MCESLNPSACTLRACRRVAWQLTKRVMSATAVFSHGYFICAQRATYFITTKLFFFRTGEWYRETEPVSAFEKGANAMEQTERFPYHGAIDADGHILEPPDTWERYIDPEFRDRAIRIRKDRDGLEVLEIGG